MNIGTPKEWFELSWHLKGDFGNVYVCKEFLKVGTLMRKGQ